MNAFPHRRSILRHSSTRIWCLLLVVIAVQTRLPMPVVHDHDALEPSVSLSQHLQRSHSPEDDVALSLPVEDGLHWHWVLPCQGENGEGSEHQDPTLPCPETASSAKELVVSQSGTVQLWLQDLLMPPRVLQQRPVCTTSIVDRRSRSSSDLYCLTAAQTCAVLCVIRC